MNDCTFCTHFESIPGTDRGVCHRLAEHLRQNFGAKLPPVEIYPQTGLRCFDDGAGMVPGGAERVVLAGWDGMDAADKAMALIFGGGHE